MKTREQLMDFIRKQKTAFVASVDEDGFPNIKAMFTPRKIEGNCFYFSTNTSSMRTQQLMKNPRASIYFYKRGRFQYEGHHADRHYGSAAGREDQKGNLADRRHPVL